MEKAAKAAPIPAYNGLDGTAMVDVYRIKRHNLTVPRPTDRDSKVRDRWQRFLTPLVGSGARVPVKRVVDAVNRLGRNDSGDWRGEFAAYLRGAQTPRAVRAFWIGAALHELGVGWCSGPVALLASGNVAAFIETLAALSANRRGLRLATELLVHGLWAAIELSDEERLREPRQWPAHIEHSRRRLDVLLANDPVPSSTARAVFPRDRNACVNQAFSKPTKYVSDDLQELSKLLEAAKKGVTVVSIDPDAQLIFALPMLYAWAERSDPSASLRVTHRTAFETLLNQRLQERIFHFDSGTLHLDLLHDPPPADEL